MPEKNSDCAFTIIQKKTNLVINSLLPTNCLFTASTQDDYQR